MLNNIKKVIKLFSNSAEGMNVAEGRRGLNNGKRSECSD